MKPPTFVRPLTDDERQALKAGLRSPEAFTLRRCQILLQSADGLRPKAIADCGRLLRPDRSATPSVPSRPRGSPACTRSPRGPSRPARPSTTTGRRRLRDLLHRSPRDFGKPTTLWTLGLAAEVAHAEGLTDRPVSGETIRQALKRLGVGWKRAKTWITSPDPAYLRKKGRATG